MTDKVQLSGAMGIFCGGCLFFFAYDDPSKHPTISDAELELLD